MLSPGSAARLHPHALSPDGRGRDAGHALDGANAMDGGSEGNKRGTAYLFVTGGQPQRSNVITSSNTSSLRSVPRHLTANLLSVMRVSSIDPAPPEVDDTMSGEPLDAAEAAARRGPEGLAPTSSSRRQRRPKPSATAIATDRHAAPRPPVTAQARRSRGVDQVRPPGGEPRNFGGTDRSCMHEKAFARGRPLWRANRLQRPFRPDGHSHIDR
jgi:hypothetical protein